MTPTIIGRIETRILVNIAIALPILSIAGFSNAFFVMTAIGVLLDFIYQRLQNLRWDDDWPLLFVLISGVVEGFLLWIILSLTFKMSLITYMSLYAVIWVLTFIAQVFVLNILFPYRRFRGGRIL